MNTNAELKNGTHGNDAADGKQDSPVEAFARQLWALRDGGGGRVESSPVMRLGRELGAAVQRQAEASETYDPEGDVKVLWAREVLAAARRREPRCMASGNLEASVAFVLGMQEAVVGLCGKDRAAGMSAE